MLLTIFMAKFTFALEPVISDIAVKSSSRGVIIVFDADGPFSLQWKSVDKNTVKAVIRNAIYGLNEYSYKKFPESAPLVSINAVEISKGNPGVDITFKLKVAGETKIEVRQKDSKQISLISRASATDFDWAASKVQAPQKLSQAAAQVKAKTEVSDVKPTSTTPVAQKDTVTKEPTVKTESKVKLLGIKVLRRGEVNELTLDFDKPIGKVVRQDRSTISLQFLNAQSELASKTFTLPDTTVYKRISIVEKTQNSAKWLCVNVVLAPEANPMGIEYAEGAKHALLTVSKNSTGLMLWTSEKGTNWNHEFFTMPTYSIDTLSIRNKIQKYAEAEMKGSTFNINEGLQEQPTAPNIQSTEIPNEIKAQENAIAEKDPMNVEQKGLQPAQSNEFIVIADKVNLRTLPTKDSTSEIIAEIPIGQVVKRIDSKKGLWAEITFDKYRGWVSARMLSDSSKVTPEQWAQIRAKRDEIARIQAQKSEIEKVAAVVEKEKAKSTENTYPTLAMAESAPVKPSVDSSKGDSIQLISDSKRMIRYHKYGRDPFASLQNDSLNESIPKVENLRLVGILFDPADKIALCEDKSNKNRPFAFREDDEVVHGQVLRIYKDKVVFLVHEYGLSRSFTLKLNSDSENSTKTVK